MTFYQSITHTFYIDMLKTKPLRLACLLLALLMPVSALAASSTKSTTNNIVLTLPAETMLASVQEALPLELPSQGRQLQGKITIESLERLVIQKNIITVHGVLSGKNLEVSTTIAGQNIQLKVGEVRLPISCDLQMRFDPTQRQLFVTPRFVEPTQNAGSPQDVLAPLLGALGGREYQVDLDALQTIKIKVGAQTIPLTMELVSIVGKDNTLILHLWPQVGIALPQ